MFVHSNRKSLINLIFSLFIIFIGTSFAHAITLNFPKSVMIDESFKISINENTEPDLELVIWSRNLQEPIIKKITSNEIELSLSEKGRYFFAIRKTGERKYLLMERNALEVGK